MHFKPYLKSVYISYPSNNRTTHIFQTTPDLVHISSLTYNHTTHMTNHTSIQCSSHIHQLYHRHFKYLFSSEQITSSSSVLHTHFKPHPKYLSYKHTTCTPNHTLIQCTPNAIILHTLQTTPKVRTHLMPFTQP